MKVTPVITSSNHAINVKGYKTGEFLRSDQAMTAPSILTPHKPLLAELVGGRACGLGGEDFCSKMSIISVIRSSLMI